MSDKKLLVGFLAGLATGLSMYAFLKSEKGREVVEAAKDKAGKWQHDLEGMMEKGKKMAGDFKDKMYDQQMTS